MAALLGYGGRVRPLSGWLPYHGNAHRRQPCGVDREQQHLPGVGVEALVGGFDLIGMAGVDEAHLLQAEAAGGASVAALASGGVPFLSQGQMKQVARRAPGCPWRPGRCHHRRHFRAGQEPPKQGLQSG